MPELITALLKLFLDNTVKFFPRILAFVFIVLSLIIIDNVLGFTFHYDKQRTISELSEISKIISDSSVDTQIKAKAMELKEEIIKRKSLHDFVNDAVGDIFRPMFVNDKGIVVKKYDHERNRVIEFLCLNWFLMFLFLFLPLYFLIKPAFNKLWKNLMMIFAVNSFLLILSIVIFFVFSLIPTIYGRPVLNYLLDFSVMFIAITINTYRISEDNWFVNRK